MDDWLTTLSAIRARDPDWRAIAAYEAPVARFLARRFPRLPVNEREDFVQEVLLAMRERIVERYDPDAGRFRAFLQVSIQNVVRDHFRRRREHLPLEPAALRAPEPTELEALDLEALLVRAIAEVHERFSTGAERDLSLVYVLSGLLVHGLSNKAIAKREGLSVDQVKRLLQRARAEITSELFKLLLGPSAPHARCAELARACLRSPRRAGRLLDAEADPAVREAVAGLTERLGRARSSLASGDMLLRGVEAVFSD